MALARWNPVREMMELSRAIDRLMEEAFPEFPRTTREGWYPVDLYETDEALVIQAVLPGVRSEDITISYEGGVLTIRGKTQPEPEEKRRYYLRERTFGEYVRSFNLPLPVDIDKAQAKLENGILTVILPKAAQVRPRTIPVRPA
jgi:HSP20 family protein